jgi:gamma-glutamyltranspeptidase/glutathione hydrolase
MHTIIPGMVTKNCRLACSFGVMGGAYQPMGHAHVLANMFDYGMDPQEALDHSRIFWSSDGVLEVEAGISEAVKNGLLARGHKLRSAAAPLGGGQIIAIDHENGVMIGGSDPRKDGMAAGY